MLALTRRHESWPLAGRFAISRGAKTTAEVIVVELADGDHRGRGECVPYARYGESLESVAAEIERARPALEAGAGRAALQTMMAAGAARNALDCALWDLEAKRAGKRAWDLAGRPPPKGITTAYTLSLDSAAKMAAAAAAARHRPLLKIKLGGDGDGERVIAVREAAPDCTLIVDANEGWRAADLEPALALMAELGVAMVEQPLPEADDDLLAHVTRPVAVCADESCHDRASLPRLVGRYDMINVKLDKTGGLTEALALVAEAEALGFGLMIGCMLATSLAMAPAMMLARGAQIVDLDGPLLMARDREPGLDYDGSRIAPPTPALWG